MHINYLYVVVLSATAAPVIAGMIRFPFLPVEMRSFFYFFILVLFEEIANAITQSRGIDNLWINNLFGLVEGIYFLMLFRYWEKSPQFRIICHVLIGIYVLTWLFTSLTRQQFVEYNVIMKSIESVFISFASIYIIMRLTLNRTESVFHDYRFWMLATTLIFFSTSLVLQATADLILEDGSLFRAHSWIFYIGIGVTCNLLYTFGFLYYFRNNIQTETFS